MATILVIDDDEDVTRLLENQFSEEGHTVLVAHQGNEGMAKAIKSRPDLIMLDVFLPDSTGFQLCTQLRKHTTTQTVPIIMMTGAARFPNQQLFGMERGANEYISKPFDVTEVGQLVNKYIGQRHVSPTAPTAATAVEAAVAVLDEPAAPAPALSDDLSALGSFLKESLNKNGASHNGASQGKIAAKYVIEKKPEASLNAEEPSAPEPERAPVKKSAPHVQPAPEPGVLAEPFSPGILASRERFVDFSLEIFALATRLSTTHAEKFLGENLLRTSMSVSARIGESRFAETKAEFMAHLAGAMKDMREAAYWLMLARKAGLLDLCAKNDLEKTCQSLMTMLYDFVASEKKRLTGK